MPKTKSTCEDIHNNHKKIKRAFACVWHCVAGQTTSKAKQLWAPAISPVWSKSEDISANKACDSAVGSLCTSTPSHSPLAKPQIHQQPGELYSSQWAYCACWGNTIIVTIFPFRWKTHLLLTSSDILKGACGFQWCCVLTRYNEEKCGWLTHLRLWLEPK